MKKIYLLIGILLFTPGAFAQTECTFTGTGAGNSNTTGDYNTFNGYRSGYSNTTGSDNTFIGRYSGTKNINATENSFLGMNSGFNNVNGSNNAFIGASSGFTNSSGANNTFVGYYSGYANLGSNNTFIGVKSGRSNTSGHANVMVGYTAGYENETGYNNTFYGKESGYYNISGHDNTFLGSVSGLENVSGDYTTMIGCGAGRANTADNNTFIGGHAGYTNTSAGENTFVGYFTGSDFFQTGDCNTFIGSNTGWNNTTGVRNTYVGAGVADEMETDSKNTAIGANACSSSSGDKNTFLGYKTYVSGNNSIAIGSEVSVTASDRVRVGNNDITEIGGIVSWSVISDGRFKKAVKENVPGLEFIKQLRPVNYTLDKEKLNKFMEVKERPVETKTTSQESVKIRTGLVAQEVEQLIKEHGYEFNGIDVPQNENDHYAIRYAEFVVPLVKALQELNGLLTEMQEINGRLREEINLLKAIVSEPDSNIQASNAGGIE